MDWGSTCCPHGTCTHVQVCHACLGLCCACIAALPALQHVWCSAQVLEPLAELTQQQGQQGLGQHGHGQGSEQLPAAIAPAAASVIDTIRHTSAAEAAVWPLAQACKGQVQLHVVGLTPVLRDTINARLRQAHSGVCVAEEQ